MLVFYFHKVGQLITDRFKKRLVKIKAAEARDILTFLYPELQKHLFLHFPQCNLEKYVVLTCHKFVVSKPKLTYNPDDIRVTPHPQNTLYNWIHRMSGAKHA